MSTPIRFGNDEFDLELIPRGDTFIVTAPGVAKYLGFRDSTAMLRAVPEDEKGYTLVCTPGGDQRVSILTEPGLYRVLGQRQSARIPDETVRAMVQRYQRFLFHEVLPAFRRGEIAQRKTPAELSRLELIEMAHAAELERLALAQQNTELVAENSELTEENDELRPQAEALAALRSLDGSLYIAEVAHIFDIGPKKFFNILYEEKILQRGIRRPYSEYLPWFRVIFDSIELPDGSEKATSTTFVRPDGVWRLYHLLTKRGHKLRSPAEQAELVLRLPEDPHRKRRTAPQAIERGNVTNLPARRDDDRPGGAA